MEVATNAEYLGKVRLFERLEPAKIDAFAAVCNRKQFEKDDILFLEGDIPDALFLIVSGRVRIERVSANGVAQVLAVRGPGEVIGEMGLIDGRPRSAQAIAQTKVKLLSLSKSDFQRQVLIEPTVCFAMMQTLSFRVRESAQLLLDARSKAVHERLHDYLRGIAEEDGWARLDVTQTALSEVLGCTREAVNRAFSQLETEGSILRSSRTLIKVK
jgi:CRP-like cAMP-binding protein